MAFGFSPYRPITSRGSWLSRRNSFANLSIPMSQALAIQNAALTSSSEYLLRKYLPGLQQVCDECDLDPEGAAHHLIGENNDVFQNGGPPELTIADLALVYRKVFEIILRCRSNALGGTEAVSCKILCLMTDYLRRDEQCTVLVNGQAYSLSLKLFLALSAISAQMESRHLGLVLSKYFLENANELLSDGSMNQSALWALGIYRSEMPDDDKFVCLRKILRRRPGLVNAIEAQPNGTRRRMMAKISRRVLSEDDSSDSLTGRRGGRGRRREWDDDLFDSVGGRRGDRGRSRWWEEDLNDSGSRLSRDLTRRHWSDRQLRPQSAPGEKRRIVRQTERLLDAADDMQVEADKLRRAVLDER